MANILDQAQQIAVLAFIEERPSYIQALKDCPASNDADYHRWTGNAEARRMLAELLGLTVPHQLGEKTQPAVIIAKSVQL